jgi:hypothetical protein
MPVGSSAKSQFGFDTLQEQERVRPSHDAISSFYLLCTKAQIAESSSLL